jgi:hypothetical protein
MGAVIIPKSFLGWFLFVLEGVALVRVVAE